ncbi:MAG TPA: hypothetical protein DCR97_05870 [Deltaproteobacteria bacterium]|nr:hypothetical protein [Deltaproteobacteria bacterium]
MKRITFLLCVVILCSSCTVAVRKEPFQWPATVDYVEGSGDMDLSWKGRTFSGSFAVRSESLSLFFFEVYGPFGQTLLQVKKQGEWVDILTGDGKRGSERLFEEHYGMNINDFIDDLMMKGRTTETSEGDRIDRAGYRVLYSQRKDKPQICWLNDGGSICLIFSDLTFTRDGQSGEGSRK